MLRLFTIGLLLLSLFRLYDALVTSILMRAQIYRRCRDGADQPGLHVLFQDRH